MTVSPEVIVFDVNETLSDMAPIAGRFAEMGAPDHLAALWFASLLRDGLATTVSGPQASFADLGRGVLRTVLTGRDLDRDLDEAVDHVLGGFAGLSVHPDVVDGVRRLERTGVRLVTLSNGAAQVAETLLEGAGIRDAFESVLSVDDAGIWKPAEAAYAYAARTCRVDPSAMLLVAVHPWDLHGGANAGLQTAWVNRVGAPYPSYFTPPTRTVTSLRELADDLAT